GDPAEDVAWPLVRAWRFGVDELHLGGIGEVEPYLERYNVLTGRQITLASLGYWEIVGNLKWAIGALTQSRRHLSGQQRSGEIALGAPLVRREAGSLARLLGHADPLPDDLDELRRLASDLNRELALRIRADDTPEGTLAHLLATVADKLRVASPRYLERYR